jgi:hypothetical protein
VSETTGSDAVQQNTPEKKGMEEVNDPIDFSERPQTTDRAREEEEKTGEVGEPRERRKHRNVNRVV